MDGENASLPKPKFETRVIEKDRLYCQICFASCLKKHNGRSKLEKITDLASFKFDSEKLKKVDHKYNKVFAFVDWNNTDEKYAHKAGKSTFFKESFLNSQQLVENSPNENDTLSTPSPSVQTESKPTSVRNSTRQNLLYKSNETKRKCLICSNHRYTKGRLDQLINIALKRAVDGTYVAQSTLKKYAEIHLKLDNEKYITSANRILLVFAANGSCYKSHYNGFCKIRK